MMRKNTLWVWGLAGWMFAGSASGGVEGAPEASGRERPAGEAENRPAEDCCEIYHLSYLAAGGEAHPYAPPARVTRVADDLSLIEPACELAAYELGIVGAAGAYSMDIDLRLELTTDPTHPEHPDNPNSLSARTRRTFHGRGQGSLELARFDFPDDAISIGESDYPIWITWKTDRPQTGVPNAGRTKAGESGPGFAMLDESDGMWAPATLPSGTPAVFYAALYCKGPAPLGACCPPQPAEPGADVVCYEELTVDHCFESRWLYESTCDDFDPPCGTHACCKPDDSCENLRYDDCIAICEVELDLLICVTDGDCPGPRTCGALKCKGADWTNIDCEVNEDCDSGETCEWRGDVCAPSCAHWQSGMYCDVGEQWCPVFACYGAVGDCFSPSEDIPCDNDLDCPDGRRCYPEGLCSPRAGCGNLSCCNAVCRRDGYCCDIAWDQACVDLAEQLAECQLPPDNDECYPGVREVELRDDDNNEDCTTGSSRCRGQAPAFNEFATSTGTDPTFCCSNRGVDSPGYGTLWYKFTAFHTSARLQTCNSPGLNSMIQVFEPGDPTDDQSACASLDTVVGCNDDTYRCGSSNQNARVCVTGLTIGRTYYVLVASPTAESLGDYTLEIESPCRAADLPPLNSECSSAFCVTEPGVYFDLENVTMDCPSEPTLPAMTNDLWYDYCATCTGNLVVETCGQNPEDEDPDTTLAVYEWGIFKQGPPQPEDLLGSNDDADAVDCAPASSVTVPVFASDLYKIRLGGKFGSEPQGFLSIECVPDDCNMNGLPDVWEINEGQAEDCNRNLEPDECDIASGHSEDCDDNDVPDECQIDRETVVDCTGVPGPCSEGPFFCDTNCDPDVNNNGIPDACETLLVESAPSDGQSLWRCAHNIVRLRFDGDISVPLPGQVLIQALAGGPDLSPEFVFTVENDDHGSPRILRIWEEHGTLQHGNSYAFRSVGGWPGVAPFEVEYVVQVGDCNADGRVAFNDLSCIVACIPNDALPDDARSDINGDGRCMFNDLAAANSSIP